MTTGRSESGGGANEEPTRADPLSTDRLLRACSRTPWEAVQRPVLGRIILTAPVGKGGMGAVYRGVHRTLGQERAVKVLLASADDALRERFLREARLTAHIDSPHLVRVHDADEDQASGLVYLEMEYVRGRSAAQWCREAAIPGQGGVAEEDALAVCLAACRGLEAAHAAGVVHRDLKPGNILIPDGPGGRPDLAAAKVADLGLARREEADASLTATHTFVGTPGFAAPEQISDAKSAGKEADVFSMGATLCALLSGRSPFEGSSTSDTIIRTTQGRRIDMSTLRKGLSGQTLALIDRCLAVQPSARYADAKALREAIERRLAGMPLPPVVSRTTPQSRSEEPTIGGAPSPVAPPPASPAPPVPAEATPSQVPPAPSSLRGKLPWIVAGVLALTAAFLLFDRRGSGPEKGASPPPEPNSGGAATAKQGRVHLQYCPPGARVFLGDREVREGDRIPAGPGKVRVTLDRHADQEVEYGANEDGDIWIRPPEFRMNRGWIVLLTKYEGVHAFWDGKAVAGRIDVPADEDHTFEFKRRGFGTQVVKGRVEPGGSADVTPPNLWSWTGELSIELAQGAKLLYELTTTAEGDAATDAAAPSGGVTWEVERLAASSPEPQLRLTVKRVHGRAVPATGEPFAFDSADAGWAKLLAEHRDAIAAAAPVALLEHGAIDVTFDADGAPKTWKPFAAAVRGLPGVAAGKDEDVQRSVVLFLVLRPDLAEPTPLGDFSAHEFTQTTAGLGAMVRDRDAGLEKRSKLKISVTDGLGESLEIEEKRGSSIVRTTVRRK